MPHRIYIDTETGRVSMMYVGEKPWHGLGVHLDEPATAAEAIQAANLDWEVVKKPLFAMENGYSQPVRDKFAVVRCDVWGTSKYPVLGVVSQDYEPLQNREAFEFFDPIVGEGAAVYHTAGALGNGERVWILAKLPEEIRVKGDDVAEKYLLLSNSHDGNSSVQIKFTPIRVVCDNTLTLALSRGPTVRVAHTKDLRERLEQARKNLRIINTRFEGIAQAFQCMAGIQLNTRGLSHYLSRVFPDPRDATDEQGTLRMRRHRAWAEYFFADGKGNDQQPVRGTLWAAYNGVAEYIDHRQTNQTDSDRLESVWFGSGYHVKARAYEVAKETVAGDARAT